jgi:hypothetical protein
MVYYVSFIGIKKRMNQTKRKKKRKTKQNKKRKKERKKKKPTKNSPQHIANIH